MMKRAAFLLLFALSAAAEPILGEAERKQLESSVVDSFKTIPIPPDSMDYAFLKSFEGDRRYLDLARRAHKTGLRQFSLSYWLFRSAKDRDAARKRAAELLGKSDLTEEETTAMVTYYEVTGDPKALEKALAASLKSDGPAGSLFLSLYGVTGDRKWLEKARKTVATAGGLLSARFLNRLGHYTGDPVHRKMAEAAFTASGRPAGETLATEWELTHDPLHVTVVGEKADPGAKALFQAALRYPAPFKRLEWWDEKEGPLPNPDVRYPVMKRAAAYVCSKKSCSLPIFEAGELAAAIDRLAGK